MNARFAVGVVLGMLVLAGAGLFGVQYSHHNSDQSLERLAALGEGLNLARSAQVDFKIQVQEWKNILLRGQKRADYEDYLARFEKQGAKVEAHLEALRQGGFQGEEAVALLEEHARLTRAYQAALQGYATGDASSIFRTDAAVRGQDRDLDARIDALAGGFARASAELVAQARGEGEERYRMLRNLVLVVATVVTVLACILAVRVR